MNGMPVMNKEQIQADIKMLQGNLKVASFIDEFRDNAMITRGLYDAYLFAGFTEEQAWSLTFNLIINSAK